MDAGHGRRLDEEVLDDLGHQPPLAGLDRPADDGRQVQLLLRESLERRFGDGEKPLGIDVADDPGLDVRDVGLADVQVGDRVATEERNWNRRRYTPSFSGATGPFSA